ncbi:acyltransferase family protein [Methylobacter tundripaludum]|uniref:acyltransferase family protein n=1 Tax=Methylobacter tundripaludum TaxID=173365 RepID=UPI0004833203|nr:acyltransferase [Methylobacter tundripaludum]
MNKSHRFVLLDGLRGIAALAVVIMHFTQHGNRTALFASSGLAVDLFFCLSGFVIAWSYYQKLVDGMSFSSYLKKRLVRLYPMFIIGILLGVLSFIIKLHYGTNSYSLSDFTKATLINAIYLPYFVTGTPERIDGIFLVNPPSWSLFFELLANFAFIFTIRFSKSLLIALTVLIGIWLIYAGITFDTSPGWSTTNWTGGFPRVGFSFMVGILIFKFFDSSKGAVKVNPLVIIAVLMSLLLVPLSEWVYYWILGALFLMPLIVWLGSRVEVKQPLFSKTLIYLGWISYPIYCLHHPMISIWDSISPNPTHFYRELLILFPLTLVITHILAKYIDDPVRAWLNRPKFQILKATD